LQLTITASRPEGVHAAVVELDALADAIGPGAEDHHARAASAADLVPRPGRPGALPARVVVRRLGLELGRAGVDRLVGAGAAGLGVLAAGQRGELGQEPRIDVGATVELGLPHPATDGLEEQLVAVGPRALEAVEQVLGVRRRRGLDVELARAHRLGEGLLEGAADGHRLADRLHVGR
jgi:hypothetical protein